MYWNISKNKIKSSALRLLWVILLFFYGTLVCADETLVRLTKIMVSNTDSSSRLTLILNERVKSKVFTLSHPDRLVIDLENTELRVNLKTIQPLPAHIINVRMGHPTSSVLRLVFVADRPMQVKHFVVKSKLIIDIATSKTKKTEVISPKLATSIPAKKTIVVVIDPGHGGKDTGAIGEKGTREKDIVLIVAKYLADLINQQPNMHAELTRKGDYFVPLRGRLQLARQNKADLFIAIHADAYFNGSASGASVYALSRRGASSEAARWLAQRDNFSELGSVDLTELNNRSHLRSVLIDLAQTATISDSLRLGTSLLDSLDNMTKLHYARVEQAPFVVLKSPDIPSVLVEVGFVSNPAEELHLRNQAYQNKLARALLSGIQKYVRIYASQGI